MDSAPQAGMNADLASALQEAEARYSAANGKSQKIAQDNCQHLPGGNTRTTLHFSPFPLVMTGGDGPWLIDADGHRYADFVNEYSAGLFGHSHPKILASVAATMKEGISLGGLNRYEGPLAQELKRRFPSMDLIRFCNSGTEANLLAVGTARAISGKPAIMVFDGAYHGSLFYFSHGASPINPPVPIITSVFNDAARATADIKANAAKLAAVIVEPMQGGAGCHAPLPGFLSALRQACDEAGVLLIFDEVMTSRLSPGGLQGLVGVRPDLTTLGKYIGGGLTLACFGGKAKIMARFDPRRPDAFPHGGTFNNNVLAMAAGVVGLTEVLTKERQDAMNKLGDKLRAGLIDVAKKHKVPLQGTGVGSIVGFHFTPTPPKNHLEIEAAQRGREGAIDALQKLMHFDLLSAGHYPSRRGYAALSIETTDKQVSDLIAAVEEFCQTRGELVRRAFA